MKKENTIDIINMAFLYINIEFIKEQIVKEKVQKIVEVIILLIFFSIIIMEVSRIYKTIIWNYRIFKNTGIKISFVVPFINKNIANDTFFTIAIGRNILQNGITNLDTLTFHENLKFPHSGVFDIIINKIYTIGGLKGIYIYTVFIAFIILASLIIIYYNNTKDCKIAVIFGIGIFYLSRFVFVARAQEISFLLFIWEFYLIEKFVNSGEKKYSIILIMIGILLANFHSSVYPVYFVMYLPYITVFFIKLVKEKVWKDRNFRKVELVAFQNLKLFFVTFGISLFTGLCSTAGTAPYTDMFKAMAGISTDFIGELSISTWNNNKNLYVGIIMIVISVFLSKEKIKLTDLFYILGFGAMAIYTYRCTYFFWLVSGISINRILLNNINTTKIINTKQIKTAVLISFLFLYMFLGINSFIWLQKNNYIEEYLYPVQLSDYIIENLNIYEVKLYNEFNYGSYLEFRGIKTFIDSRSGMFTEEFNPKCTVLKDWVKVNEDVSNYREVFDKYKFTHAITQTKGSLFKKLEEDSSYYIIYTDDNFTLFEKRI